MSDGFGYADIGDLALVKVSAERLGPRSMAEPSETTFTINVHMDADGLGATVNIAATVHAPGAIDQASYRGEVAYRADFYGPLDSRWHGKVIALLWPYLRATLLEHSTRMGVAMTVPLDCPQLPPPQSGT